MRALSQFRPRSSRGAASEVYSAVVVVAITLALSGAAYFLADFHVSPVPVYSERSFATYGTPSFLHVLVNSSAPTSPAELRVDGASSLRGVLALTSNGYSTTSSLCNPGETTFFSVLTTTGTVSVLGSGVSWVDGVQTSEASVLGGWHEVVISNGSDCAVNLPGGIQASAASPYLSPLPRVSSSSRFFIFLVPYSSSGHLLTMVFDGGIQVLGF